MIKKTAVLIALAILINTVLLGFIWAHHMFVTGLNPFLGAIFSLLTLLIAIPIVIFAIRKLGKYLKSIGWIGPAPAFLLGFFILLIGDLTHILFVGNSTIDIQLHDTFFVLAHVHLMAIFAVICFAFYTVYWGFPRITGKPLNAPMSYLHFVFTLIGAYAFIWPVHYMGLAGMPRRYIDYNSWTDITPGVNVFQMNLWTLLIFGQLFFVINLIYSAMKPKK